MNKIFKVIWSKTRHCNVVVSELANNHSSSESTRGTSMVKAARLAVMALVCGTVLTLGGVGYANPVAYPTTGANY